MNDQNETAQLRFLEETAIRLRQNGFTVEPIEDHHLPVCWEKGRLCRISGKGSVLYRQENVDSIRAQDALQVVIDTAKMTSEYMAILEYAPQLKATGLTGDYRILADFGDAVLAGHPTERGVQFVTWEWDFDRKGVHHGHYFQDDYDAAKRDFTVRSGLVPKDALFEPEQLAEIYRALAFVREQDETLFVRTGSGTGGAHGPGRRTAARGCSAAAGCAGTERHDNEIGIHAGRTEMSGIFYFRRKR